MCRFHRIVEIAILALVPDLHGGSVARLVLPDSDALGVVAALVGGLLSDERIGQAVTAQMSFRRIAGLYGALINLRVPNRTLRSRAHDSISRATRLEDERNTVIHSTWTVAEDGSAIRVKIRARRKQGVSFAEAALDLERLKAVANGMKECSTVMLATQRKRRYAPGCPSSRSWVSG